jgi:molecular chaperone GrpE
MKPEDEVSPASERSETNAPEADTAEAGAEAEAATESAPSEGEATAEAESIEVADEGEAPEEGAEPEPDPLEVATAEAASWKDKCLRTAADFDNFRKRSRREITDADRHGRQELLRELLPVFDNLERAAAHAESATDVKSLTDGIRMVMRLFKDTLEKIGVERISAVGQAFDPALHEAIQHMETDEHPPGQVAAEVQAGYRMGERLVRPSMVVVAKAKPSVAPDAADEDDSG